MPSNAYDTVVETSKVAKKTKAKSIKAGKTITTYGTLTRNGVKYYKVSKKASRYIKASNVDGVFVTLKKSTAIYTKALKKTKTTYKKYYIVGVGQYVVNSNFR